MAKCVLPGKDLFSLCPEIAKEWDYEKNHPLTPDKVAKGCNKKVWWVCSVCENEWQATVNHRTSKSKKTGTGTGCPACAARKRADERAALTAKLNNFEEKYPDLAAEWHHEKNGCLKASDVAVSSNKKVWWKCSFCGGEWQETVNRRTSRHSGCPHCSKTGSSFPEQFIYYYLKQLFPDALFREKIDNYEFDIFIPSHNTAIEYDGVFYHNSSSSVEKENKKDCFCADNNIRIIRIRDPRLPDTEKAERITSYDKANNADLEKATKELFFLLGVSEMPDISAVRDFAIIQAQYKLRKKEKSLAFVAPDIASEWNHEKNASLTPENIIATSHHKVWWKCSKCGYEWQAGIEKRGLHRSFCPVCLGRIAVPGYNDLKTFNPELAAQWHPTKNGDVTPEMITTRKTQAKAWWLCPTCGHEWESVIYTRIKGAGCPKCSSIRGAEKNRKNAAQKCNIAEAYPNLINEWMREKNEPLTPYNISPGCNKKVWWKCSACGNEWQTAVSHRTKRGTDCPACKTKKMWATRKANEAKKRERK